jgi:hypothetical protein
MLTLDVSSLLSYNARYYDPQLARFISADSVLPGNASGGLDGVALKGPMVDFHEPGLVSTLNASLGGGLVITGFQISSDTSRVVYELHQSAASPKTVATE